MSQRTERIFQMIVDSRAELQLSVLNGKMAEQTMDQWVKRLQPVPDRYLDECYTIAMNAHTTRSPLIPKELRDAWEILAKRPNVNRPPERETTCPNHCSADGWIILTATAVVQFDFLTSEYLYAKPCPIHRSRTAIKTIADLGPRLHRPTTIDSPYHPSGYAVASTQSGMSSAGAVAQEALDFPEEDSPASD